MHNARRLAKAVYARIPLFPQSVFLNGADVSTKGGGQTNGKYQGKMVKILPFTWRSIEVSVEIPVVLRNKVTFRKFKTQQILAWATSSHENICPLLGVFEREAKLFFVYAHGENGTLSEWRRTSNPSVVEVQARVSLSHCSMASAYIFLELLEVAKAIQHMHLSGIYLGWNIEGVRTCSPSNFSDYLT
jgi:hypothetical protein